jgi:RecB family endonuclease NucS
MRKTPERKLEDWLCKNLSLFNPNYKFIGRQIRYYTSKDRGYGCFMQIDILAQDIDGTDIIIEIKNKATKYSIDMQLKYYMEHWPHKSRGILAAYYIPQSIFKNPIPSNVEIWRLSDYTRLK